MKQYVLCILAIAIATILYCRQGKWENDVPEPGYLGPTEKVLREEEPVLENPMGVLNARAACLMDAANGRVLFGKDENVELPMASTTKIMTCILALEHCQTDEIVTVSSYAASMPDVQMNIKAGEHYRLLDLLYSMMLESHNDSAVAVAEHVAGSEEEFCRMMTEKAKNLGCVQTMFGSANGLDREMHYTTASELALIASYAMKNPMFVKIIQTQTHTVKELDGKRTCLLSNINKYLYMDSDAMGIKTGFTGKAGYCFVGATAYEDTVLISVVLGSGWPPHKSYKWTDTKQLVEYGRTHFHSSHMELRGEVLGTVSVVNGRKGTVSVGVREDYGTTLLLGGEKVHVRYEVCEQLTAPVNVGDEVGEMTLYIGDTLYVKLPICAEESVPSVDLPYFLEKLLGGI